MVGSVTHPHPALRACGCRVPKRGRTPVRRLCLFSLISGGHGRVGITTCGSRDVNLRCGPVVRGRHSVRSRTTI